MAKVPKVKSKQRRPHKAEASLLQKLFVQVGRRLLALWGLLLIGVVVAVGGWAFHHYYFMHNATFLVHPDQIEMKGNSILPRAWVLEAFGLKADTNGFALVTSDVIPRLRREMPLLKHAQMAFEMGHGVEIRVEERTPLARLAGTPFVVDDEGVVFIYPRATSGYPEIGGFEMADFSEPGQRLPQRYAGLLHLIEAEQSKSNKLPSVIRQVRLIGSDPEDGLMIVLADGRRITMTWDGIEREETISNDMVERLRNVGCVLRSPMAVGRKHFDATVPKRVAASVE